MLKPSPFRVLASIFAGIILLLIAAWLSNQTGQICEYDQATHQNNCPSYNLAFFILIKLTDIINLYGVAITALATIVVAVFTATIWNVSQSQLNRSQEIERAYVSGGGWRYLHKSIYKHDLIAPQVPDNFGIEMLPTGDWLITEPTRFFELHINNHGKTPAFLHHAQVGFCDAAAPLPVKPPYGERFSLNDAIGPGDQSRRLRTIPIEGEWARTVICGRYYWRDIWDREWSSGFIYEIASGPAGQNGSISVESPEVYWRDRQESQNQDAT